MRPHRPYYFFALLGLPLLFVLQSPALREPLRGYALSVLKPALLTFDSVRGFITDSGDQLIYFWSTFRNQEKHQRRIAELESQLLNTQEMMKENDRLKKLLDFKQSLRDKAMTARIVGWDSTPWRKVIILDKGKKSGIQKDSAVVVPEGLAGKILDVGPEISRALLLTDPDSRVSVLTDKTRSQGMVTGLSGPLLSMRYLELESGVEVGETVLSSGVGGLIPKGIRIGKIIAISRSEDGLHLNASVDPAVKFSKLEEVLCLESFRLKS
ncbi:MAG: rod shape-determining protein MreC [Candidatus Omnitrophica bacterium]|nr:rod shape-determining protein MreC [Candidatus Omnitrophota bacterium]